ncbi:MAG TPA: hypothetical protein PK022_07310 [Syntrophales bacterium]|nr:hypothetical protein [Syntrophales bacterium]
MNIIKLIIIAGLLYLAYRVFRFLRMPAQKGEPKVLRRKEVKGIDLVEDPVCHTYIPLSSVYKKVVREDGETVYFCSHKCFEEYKSQTNQEDI